MKSALLVLGAALLPPGYESIYIPGQPAAAGAGH
jgi:hypothetical protein